MSNHEYHLQFMEAMKRLHGDGKRTCRHPDCTTITLGTYCQKHNEEYKRQAPADDGATIGE